MTALPRLRAVSASPTAVAAPDRAAATAALVARASDGDVAAFEQLIAHYQPHVFRFAMAFAATPDEARDLSQEALIKVYRSIGSFRFQSAFSTWLFTIVKHVFLDNRRSRAARERALETPIDDQLSNLGEAARAEDQLVQQDDRRALWAALGRVPKAYRAVVVMFDVQGLSYDEIATSLAIPVGTVKSRLKRGRDALRAEIFRNRSAFRLGDAAPPRTPTRGSES